MTRSALIFVRPLLFLTVATLTFSNLLSGLARADVNGRLSLSGMFLKESQDPPANSPPGTPSDASPITLGYGDLRAMIEGRRLAGGVEFGADLRLRITSDFTAQDTITGNLPITARGYAGGREYDLREAWIGRRGESFDFAIGRLMIREADALRIDGARFRYRFSPAWYVSVFGGLYPDPYARSVPDDYISPSQLAGAVGASVGYSYTRLWGSASAVGTFFGGPNDGGNINPASPAGDPGTEAARVYLTWTNYIRIASWLDLFHDLVIDVAGSAGAQVTRADVLANFHFGRLTIAAGYDHMSSIAVDMYLLHLLGDRSTFMPGTIENNLIVERTARDEGRLRADVNPIGRFKLYGEGRLRRRAIADQSADPNFANDDPLTAWDVTVGARSNGDLARLRLGASYEEISDYRAETHLVTVDAGRDFYNERVSLDLNFIWEGIRDDGAGTTAAACPLTMTATTPANPLAPTCYGHQAGSVYEGGATLTIRPSTRWLLLLDYRLVYTDPNAGNAITTHVGFARVETRF